MEKYGSDKGQKTHMGRNWHNYTIVYNALFQNVRMQPLRIFEVGLGTNNVNVPSNMGIHGKPGASLMAWREYFPNSLVFGADIDKNILFEQDRIKTFFCDQLDPNKIESMWNHEDLREKFDIIIEDGLHTFEANKCFFENSFHKVNSGGIYVIEDVSVSQLDRYEKELMSWKNKFNITYIILNLPHNRNIYDNCLILIKHDNQSVYTS
jgi:hypothetical protein